MLPSLVNVVRLYMLVISGVVFTSLKYFCANGHIALKLSNMNGSNVIFCLFISFIIDSPLMILLCCLLCLFFGHDVRSSIILFCLVFEVEVCETFFGLVWL